MRRKNLFAACIAVGALAFSSQAHAADLEERVAELEATTARKGNRKVSLTVYGHVNTAILFWDDGRDSDTYVVDSDQSSTRFGFKGNARINPNLMAGYHIEVEFQSAASNLVNADGGSTVVGLRLANLYLQHKDLGRVTLGQADAALSGTAEVDLGRTWMVTLSTGSLNFAGFDIITEAGGDSGFNFGDLVNFNYEFNRENVIKYTSPKFANFQGELSWGENDKWSAALRYANKKI